MVFHLFVIIVILPSYLAELAGPNTCTKQEIYTTKVLVSELQPYDVREFTWCLNFPPRCSKYTTKFRNVEKYQTLTKFRPVVDCCKGYKKSDDDQKCIAICTQMCTHGNCIAPDICKCQSGYGGSACQIKCPLGLWGDKCQYDCMCKNNSTCDLLNGNCICENGWIGQYCDSKCHVGTYGKGCMEKCPCSNGECHHISGRCTKCSDEGLQNFCQNETITASHEHSCACQNGGICQIDNGTACLCELGWTGLICENPCLGGYYGFNCSNKCDCHNNANCHHISGKCICPPGYIGNRCLNVCPEGRYGMNCDNTCECQNGANCSNFNGECTCPEEWTGQYCNITVCDIINRRCNCAKTVTEAECERICSIHCAKSDSFVSCNCPNPNFACDKFGECVCRQGYDGINCDSIVIDHNTVLIYGSVICLIIFIILAVAVILIIWMFLNKARKARENLSEATRAIPLNNLRTIRNNLDTQTYVKIKELQYSIPDNYYFKDNSQTYMKNYNKMYKSADRYLDHVYAEIKEYEYLYDQLDHNQPINSRKSQYMSISKSLGNIANRK